MTQSFDAAFARVRAAAGSLEGPVDAADLQAAAALLRVMEDGVRALELPAQAPGPGEARHGA